MYFYLDMIIVVFQPIGYKAFFSYPANEFTGSNVNIDLLNDIALVELEYKLYETSDNQNSIYYIEEYLINKLRKTGFYNYQRNTPFNHNFGYSHVHGDAHTDRSFTVFQKFRFLEH